MPRLTLLLVVSTACPLGTASAPRDCAPSHAGMEDAGVSRIDTGACVMPDSLHPAGAVSGSVRVPVQALPNGSAGDTATVSVGRPPPTRGPLVVGGPESEPCPPGAILVTTADDGGSKVAAAPRGATLCWTAGLHTRSRNITPRDDQILLAEPGVVITGMDTARYFLHTLAATPKRVVVKGFTVERFLPPAQNGAIQGDNGIGWIVEGNEIRLNRETGVRVGPGWRFRRNFVHHNEKLGVGAFKAHGTVIDTNTVEFNPARAQLEPGKTAEASNIKVVRTDSVVLRGNTVRDGPNKGIWLDYMHRWGLIDGNVLLRHGQAAIWCEVGYACRVINNTIDTCNTRGVGWLDGAISVTNSPDVEVAGNRVRGCANGVGGMQAAGYPRGLYGRAYLARLWVHDNDFTLERGRTGIVQNVGNDSVFFYWGNRFERNTYHTILGLPFAWRNRGMDWAGWRQAGQDLTGTLIP